MVFKLSEETHRTAVLTYFVYNLEGFDIISKNLYRYAPYGTVAFGSVGRFGQESSWKQLMNILFVKLPHFTPLM